MCLPCIGESLLYPILDMKINMWKMHLIFLHAFQLGSHNLCDRKYDEPVGEQCQIKPYFNNIERANDATVAY